MPVSVTVTGPDEALASVDVRTDCASKVVALKPPAPDTVTVVILPVVPNAEMVVKPAPLTVNVLFAAAFRVPIDRATSSVRVIAVAAAAFNTVKVLAVPVLVTFSVVTVLSVIVPPVVSLLTVRANVGEGTVAASVTVTLEAELAKDKDVRALLAIVVAP